MERRETMMSRLGQKKYQPMSAVAQSANCGCLAPMEAKTEGPKDIEDMVDSSLGELMEIEEAMKTISRRLYGTIPDALEGPALSINSDADLQDKVYALKDIIVMLRKGIYEMSGSL
jgi:hypothetical protein